jgi:hypothetical protein
MACYEIDDLEARMNDLEDELDDIPQFEGVKSLANLIINAKELDEEFFDDLKIWAYKIINNENPTNRPSSEIR